MATIQDIDKYLSCDWYYIEEYEGNKCIHIVGNWYYTSDEYEKPYRDLEVSWFIVPLKDFLTWDTDDYDYFQENLKQYISDRSESEMVEEWSEFLDKHEFVELGFDELTMDTPLGFYVDNGNWWKTNG